MKKIIFAVLILCVIFNFSCFASEEDELFIGEYAYNHDSYDDAIVILKRFLRLHPLSKYSSKAHFLIAMSFYEINDFVSAIESLRKITDDLSFASIDFKDKALLWLVKVQLENHDYSAAKLNITRFFNKFPESQLNNKAFLYLIESFLLDKDYITAKQLFEKYAHRTNNIDILHETASKLFDSLYSSNNYAALKEFIIWIRDSYFYLETPLATFYLAQSYFYLDELESAKESYKNVIKSLTDESLKDISYLNLGWIFLSSENYKEAAEQFSLVGQLKDAGLQTKLVLGKSRLEFKENNYEVALDLLNEINEAELKDVNLLTRLHFYKADVYFELEQYEKAVENLKALKNNLNNLTDSEVIDSVYYRLVDCYLRLGDVDSAITTLEDVLNKINDNSKKIDLMFKLAEIYETQLDNEKAIALYQEIFSTDTVQKNISLAGYKIGSIYILEANYEQAINYFEQIKDSSFLDNNFKFDLAVAYFNNKQFLESEEVIKEFLNIFSDNDYKLRLQYLSGLNRLALKEYVLAKEMFSYILSHTNDKAILVKAELGIIDCLSSQGKINSSIDRLEGLRSKYPGSDMNAEILFRLADIYYFDNQLDMALRYVDNLLRFYPDFTDKEKALYLLAGIHKQRADYRQALLVYEQAKEYAKEEELLLNIANDLSEIYSSQGKVVLAIKAYKDFLKGFPGSVSAYVEIARIYIKLNKEEERDRFIEESISNIDRNSKNELIFYFAQSLEEQGLFDQAVSLYERLFECNDSLGIKAKLRLAKIFENEDYFQKALSVYSQIENMDIEESKYAKEMIKDLNLRISNQQ